VGQGVGTLYVISTPIGNLEDLTRRAARVLAEVDGVLAEDTRRASILLGHLGVRVAVTSLHDHNEAARTAEVVSRLDAGETLALISDAGTPLVSDPGERLIPRVLEAGHEVVPLPGPSAVLAALVGSGLPTLPFVCFGFAPRKGPGRTALLERLTDAGETAVLFESPERTAALLAELALACGSERRACVARELTKIHEEFRRGTLGELARYYGENPPRGEVTLVVAPSEDEGSPASVDEAAVRALAGALLEEGTSPSRAAREVARRLGLPRNRVYALVQELAGGQDPASRPT
jgi:16S rRNA (cytidine1402-2'-O)-methyltransferase